MESVNTSPEPIKSPTRANGSPVATAATLMCGPCRKAAKMDMLTRDTRKGIKQV